MFSTLSSTQKGMILILLGYTGFAWSDAVVKILSADYSTLQIITSVMSVSAAIMLCTRPWTHHGSKTTKKQMGIHVLRGVLNFAISILFIMAISKLPLASVYTFIFVKPFFAVILTMLMYGEKVSPRRWMAIALGFAGILIAMRPGTGHFDMLLLFPIAVAALAALMFVVSKSLNGASVFRLGFYPAAVTAVCSLPFSAPTFIIPDLAHVPLFLLSGTGITIGILGVTMAYRMAPSSAVSPFHYSQMIWGLIFGALIFNDQPDLWMMIGAGVIIISGLFLIREEKAN